MTILNVCKSIYNSPVVACLLRTEQLHLCGQSLQKFLSLLKTMIVCFTTKVEKEICTKSKLKGFQCNL
jgi:hypothetical protein